MTILSSANNLKTVWTQIWTWIQIVWHFDFFFKKVILKNNKQIKKMGNFSTQNASVIDQCDNHIEQGQLMLYVLMTITEHTNTQNSKMILHMSIYFEKLTFRGYKSK